MIMRPIQTSIDSGWLQNSRKEPQITISVVYLMIELIVGSPSRMNLDIMGQEHIVQSMNVQIA